MSKNENDSKDIEASLAKVITAFVLVLLLYIVYGTIERGLDSYGAAAMIGALLGFNAFIIRMLKIRLKRDEEKEQLKQDLQSCKNDLRDSKATVEEQSKNISEKEENIKSITADLDDIKQKYEELSQLKDELEDKLRTTSDELDSTKEVYKKTKDELLETGTKLSEALVQIEELKKQVSELSSSVESLTHDNQEKDELLKIIIAEKDNLKINLNRTEAQLSDLSNKIRTIRARVKTNINVGVQRIEERHFIRTWLNQDSYMLIVKNIGTAPCYRLQGNYILHRMGGNPIRIPVRCPAIYEGRNSNNEPTEVQINIECTGIDVELEYQDIIGNPSRYEKHISPNGIRVQRK